MLWHELYCWGYFIEIPWLKPDMDFQDNIPRNYLQLLLGKFPFSEVGEHDPTQSKPGGTDLSDGEYAIQEQDSDDDDYWLELAYAISIWFCFQWSFVLAA